MTEAEEITGPPSLDALVAAYGGYANITPEAWQIFDAQLAAWKERLRLQYTPLLEGSQKSGASTEACSICRKPAHYGYRQGDAIEWFCAAHRLAKNWADATI